MNIDEDMELLIFNYLKNSNSFTSFLELNTPVVSPSNLVDILTEEKGKNKKKRKNKRRKNNLKNKNLHNPPVNRVKEVRTRK